MLSALSTSLNLTSLMPVTSYSLFFALVCHPRCSYFAWYDRDSRKIYRPRKRNLPKRRAMEGRFQISGTPETPMPLTWRLYAARRIISVPFGTHEAGR